MIGKYKNIIVYRLIIICNTRSDLDNRSDSL